MTFELTFKLARGTSYYLTKVIVPLILLTALTLTQFFFDIHRSVY